MRLVEEYRKAAKAAKDSLRDDARKTWSIHIEKGIELRAKGDFKAFWRWLRGTTGKSCRGCCSRPTRQADGSLASTEDEILSAHYQFYADLCRDPGDPAERERAWWKEHEPLQEREELRLEGCDSPIT